MSVDVEMLRTHKLELGKEDATSPGCGPSGASSGRHDLRDVFPAQPRLVQSLVRSISGSQIRSAVPDQHGNTLSESLAWSYTVSADCSNWFTINDSRTVTVVEKACSQLDFWLAMTSHSGLLPIFQWSPVPDIVIGAARRDSTFATGYYLKRSEEILLMDDMILLPSHLETIWFRNWAFTPHALSALYYGNPIRCRRRNHSPYGSGVEIT